MSRTEETAEGAGPFTTRLTWHLDDGSTAVWESRRARKRGLLTVLAAGETEARSRSADTVSVGRLRTLNAVPVLEKRLTDSGASEEHKVSACTALRALREKSSIMPLVSALKDQSARVRKEAALALGVIAPPEAEAALLTALSDGDDDVRYFAADALGNVRTAAVTQAIETRLAAETSPVVRSALMAAKNKLDRAASR